MAQLQQSYELDGCKHNLSYYEIIENGNSFKIILESKA